MKRLAESEDAVVAIPPVRDVIEVGVAVVLVAVQVRDARIAVLVLPDAPKYTEELPYHCPSNTLWTVPHLGT
ncbi:MAG: hypothetical protein AAB932_05850 [Patescibacteria group bacterium]